MKRQILNKEDVIHEKIKGGQGERDRKSAGMPEDSSPQSSIKPCGMFFYFLKKKTQV